MQGAADLLHRIEDVGLYWLEEPFQFVASLDRPTLSEFSVADSPIASSLLAEPFLLEGGHVAVPRGPGLGVELDEDLVAHLRIG